MVDAMRDALQRGDFPAMLSLALREIPTRSEAERVELSLFRLLAFSSTWWRSRRLLDAGMRLADRTLPALAAVRHPWLLHALNWAGGLSWAAGDVTAATRHMRHAQAIAATVPPVLVLGLDAHVGTQFNSLAVAEVTRDDSLCVGSFDALTRWLDRQERMTGAVWQTACLLGRVAVGRQESEAGRRLTMQAASVLAGFGDPARASRGGVIDSRITLNMLTDTIPLLAALGMNEGLREWLQVLQIVVSQKQNLTTIDEFYLWTCLTEVAALQRAAGTRGFTRLVARALPRVDTLPAFYMDRVHRVLKQAAAVQPRLLRSELATLLTPASWPYGANAFGWAQDVVGDLAAGRPDPGILILN